MTSSQLGDIVGNEPQLCYSEWEHFVQDEAISRGVDTNDSDKMEELDEILQQEAQDHRDHLEEVAYEDSLEGY
tara:strand:+ start:685 stop:903 length:219 start_codon:yes stop_codon:yes gene_type:complete